MYAANFTPEDSISYFGVSNFVLRDILIEALHSSQLKRP
jgi:hypothetical protein